jgi:tRNA 2-thiouridine synthesizing protein A
VNTADTPPRVLIDGGDRACIALLMELSGRIARVPPATVIHLTATDPAAPLDLAAWCHVTGHAYLGPVAEPCDQPAYAIRVSAVHRQTEPHSPWRLRP